LLGRKKEYNFRILIHIIRPIRILHIQDTVF
jgi:hypothetical protein